MCLFCMGVHTMSTGNDTCIMYDLVESVKWL